MLACSQDIYFHNDGNPMNNTNFHDPILNIKPGTLSDCQQKEKRMRLQQRKDSMLNKTLDNHDLTNMSAPNNNLKDKEEQVWPPEVESAFIEALESIPKLGRRKILVNGKPCGRNELISDFIFRKTSKIRTRKQVSSHIQVLKNTRKGDAHFMRLLTDSVDGDESANFNSSETTTTTRSNGVSTTKPKGRQTQHPMPYQLQRVDKTNNAKMKTYQSLDSLSSDESSINSSPSPTSYMFDLMYGGDVGQQQIMNMLQLKDFYEPSIFNPMTNPESLMDDMADPFFGMNAPMVPLLEEQPTETLTEEELLMSSLNMLKKKTSRKVNKKLKTASPSTVLETGSKFPLWPNYLCLYLEYTVPYDPCRPLSHTLSQLPHCQASGLVKVPMSALPTEKCPPILNQTQSKTFPVLLAKTKLDLNLNLSEFTFNNTFFFEAHIRRTIECTTTIYSFGNVVLESKEVQQALWVSEGKYMYNFVFVNQFFDAFMKGIRSLQSWGEVDIAVNNLCIVQSFEDIETKFNTSAISKNNMGESAPSNNTPLLMMVYEFERGNGTIDVSFVDDQVMDIDHGFDFLNNNI